MKRTPSMTASMPQADLPNRISHAPNKLAIASFALLLCAPFHVNSAIYKYIDKDGNITFTDKPRNTDAAYELKKINTLKIAPKSDDIVETIPQAEPAEPDKPFTYSQFVITMPSQDENFVNNGGNVVISAALSPSLRYDHKVTLLLNGSQHDKPIKSTSFTLTGMDRGSYEAVLRITDEKGATVATSNAVSFHVKKFFKKAR